MQPTYAQGGGAEFADTPIIHDALAGDELANLNYKAAPNQESKTSNIEWNMEAIRDPASPLVADAKDHCTESQCEVE